MGTLFCCRCLPSPLSSSLLCPSSCLSPLFSCSCGASQQGLADGKHRPQPSRSHLHPAPGPAALAKLEEPPEHRSPQLATGAACVPFTGAEVGGSSGGPLVQPCSSRDTQSRVPKATSRWLWKLSKEESPQPLGSPWQRPVHPTSTPEANVKLLCSCNFHVAPGQRPAPLSPASICKTRSRFHTNISPQAACGATFHESLSCSPPRRSSLSVTRWRCARLRQKVGRGSF